MKQIIEFVAFAIMLGVSTVFGFLGKAPEMGLAIVAGAIAFAFANLDRFTKIKGAGFEAELKEQIEAVIEKETEPMVSGEVDTPVPDTSKVDANTRAVINALQHHEYTWRYMGGLKKDTKLSTDQVNNSLSWLMKHGYARQSLGKHGAIWNLTEDGRYLSAVIAFEDV